MLRCICFFDPFKRVGAYIRVLNLAEHTLAALEPSGADVVVRTLGGGFTVAGG